MFLGLAITVIAILAAGAIALLRPSSADRQLFELPINKGDIQLEVNKLSPAEAFIRFEPVVSSLPGFVEVISQNALPPHLILDLQLLAKFEGPGPQPMAPKSAAGLAKQAGERNAEIISRLQKRRAMNDGLWLVAIAAVFGVLLAGSSLVFSVETPPRRSAARGR
ncbi:MAG TPA: hypothetical protein VFE46_11785 [Pirellulales bacterium]|nr:hypothetical protein [Pirellulales bacterium]